jgi:hypothetical protein
MKCLFSSDHFLDARAETRELGCLENWRKTQFLSEISWPFKEVEDGTKEEVITVEMATQEKDKGTKFFRMNQLQEACETYTNYINMCHRIEDHADLFKSKMIYQGYANR